MNIGQLLETELGWAASTLDDWFSAPVFQSPTTEQIEEKLKAAGLPVTSKTKLRDGRTGEYFVNPVFCGIIYFLKLHHWWMIRCTPGPRVPTRWLPNSPWA